jgi:hypothetical protein
VAGWPGGREEVAALLDLRRQIRHGPMATVASPGPACSRCRVCVDGFGRVLIRVPPGSGRVSERYTPPTWLSWPAHSRSRSTNFWILPVEVFGSGPNST